MARSGKILLVEDQAIIALAESRMLRAAGYSVEVAHSGDCAVEVALGDPGIELVLMDVDLGKGLSGPEAALRILAGRAVPIVFLTSHSEREMVEKVRDITRYGYVIKDSGEFVLLSSIEMAFELFEAHRKVEEERNTIRQVIENIDEAFYLKEVESGKMLFVSPAYERIWGLPAGQLERDPASYMAAVHPDDLPGLVARRDEMAAGGRDFDLEYRVIRPGGETRWVRARTRRVLSPDGKTIRYAATALDITDRKLVELALEDERRRLAAVLASIPSLVIVTGPESEGAVYVSESSTRITGWTPEELMSGFRQFVHEDDREKAGATLKAAYEEREEGYDYRFKAVRKDGSVWLASASWNSLRDETGAYRGRIFQLVDVTERG